MPEGLLRKRGGVVRYRTIKKGGKTFTVAVVRKKGPHGGKTVAWPKKKGR